jgi:hypothetical protein
MAAKGTDNGKDKKSKGAAGAIPKGKAKSKKPDAAAGKTKSESKSSPVAAGPKKSQRLLEWEEPEKLILVEGWAREGLSEKQIAHNMGCAYSTLKEWKKISSAISAALKKGKEVSDFLVENALFASAISGNVVAQIFWLKNRKPELWKDKIEQKIEADVENENSGVIMIAPRLEE